MAFLFKVSGVGTDVTDRCACMFVVVVVFLTGHVSHNT